MATLYTENARFPLTAIREDYSKWEFLVHVASFSGHLSFSSFDIVMIELLLFLFELLYILSAIIIILVLSFSLLIGVTIIETIITISIRYFVHPWIYIKRERE